MAKLKKNQELTKIRPNEIQGANEKSAELIKSGFKLFGDHTRQLASDLKEFEESQRKIREDMQRGARRTDGRII